ncbi:WcaI family glycosyltransferase [Sphingomonas sp. HH69]
MNILLLGLNYAPEPVGIGPYTTGLARGLVGRGHQVTVLSGKPYYPQWRPYPGQPKGRTITVENGVRIIRVPHYIPESPSGGKRIAHHLSFAASVLAPALREAGKAADLVFTVAPSLLSVPVAALAARRAKAPLWLHVQDFEVEAAFATGLLDAKSTAARLARGIEDRILRLADLASSISPQMCAKLESKGIPARHVYQLRNWSNADFDFAHADPSGYRREWGLGDRKVALYSGNIANKQGLEIVIEAARVLSVRDDLAFVICGEGPNRERLQSLASGLGNVQFHDLQPSERMADFLSLADVHLLPQVVGAADLVLPSKLTNMLASGRPVVATAAAGTGLYDEVEGCGINTPPGDSHALAMAIAGIIDDPALAMRLGECARQRAMDRWSQNAIIDAMEGRAMSLVSLKAVA